MRGWKLLIIAWVFLGAASLIVGVTRITFACLWVLYLMELMANYRGEKGDQTDEILKELESAAPDARRDMGIDDTERMRSMTTDGSRGSWKRQPLSGK